MKIIATECVENVCNQM